MLQIGYVPLLRLALGMLLAASGQAPNSTPSPSPSPLPTTPTAQQTPAPDALENNWDFAHAAPVAIGVTYDLSFVCPVADGCTGGDHDFLRVPVKRDVTYLVGAFDLGPGADTVLDLFWGSEELPVASNDDAGPLGFASLLRWHAPGDGEAVVRVGPRNGALGPEGLGERAGSYRFAVAVEGSPLARQIEERIRAQTTLATATPTSTVEPARPTPTAPRVVPALPQAPPPAPPAPTRAQTTTVTADTSASSGGPSINDGSTGRAVVVAPSAVVRVLPRQDSDVLQRLGEGTQVNLTGRAWGGWVRVVTDDGVMPGWTPAQGLRLLSATSPTAGAAGSGLAPTAATGVTTPSLEVTRLEDVPAPTPAAAPARAAISVAVTLKAAPEARTGKRTASDGEPLDGLRVQLVSAFGDLLAEALSANGGRVTLTRDLPGGAAVFVRMPAAGLEVPVDPREPELLIVLPAQRQAGR